MKTYNQFIKESDSGLALALGLMTIQAISSSVKYIIAKNKNKQYKRAIELELKRIEKISKKDKKVTEGFRSSGAKGKNVIGKHVKTYLIKKVEDIKKYIVNNPDEVIDKAQIATMFIVIAIINKLSNKKDNKSIDIITNNNDNSDISGVVSKTLVNLKSI